MNNIHNELIKIAVEGLPGTGKTTLYNSLIKRYASIISSKSPDFVKSRERQNSIVSKIEKILKSRDPKFLTLRSPIGETLLLLTRIAFKQNKKQKKFSMGIQISDKSIDTLISHAIPRLLETGYFKNEEESFKWIINILDPFYKYPDLVIFLKPRNLEEFLKRTRGDKNERAFLEQISRTYDFLYTSTKFNNRTKIIYIDKDTTPKKVLDNSVKIIDKYLKR